MVHGLAGDATALRQACRNADVNPEPNRQHPPTGALRRSLQDKFVDALPPLPLRNFLEAYLSADSHPDLAEYGAAAIPAKEAQKIKDLLVKRSLTF